MPSVTLIPTRRFGDERGWFAETYSREAAARHGIDDVFVQDNHSLSRPAGTLRGLHFQVPPHGQAKLVRCLRGRLLDVVADLRAGSPTFGRTLAVELSAEGGGQLYVPVGFAHGLLTLEPDTEVAYKVSAPYRPESEGGIRFDDPDLAIRWPWPAEDLVVSARDRALGPLSGFASPFPYDGAPLPAELG